MNWDFAVALISSSAAGLSVLVTALHQFRESSSRRAQRDKLERLDAETVLSSGELDRLGRLLFDELGRTAVADYARDGRVRSEFRAIFNEVAHYLDEPDSVPGGRDEPLPANTVPPLRPEPPQHDEDLQHAFVSIEQGEPWNALARIRRRLEVELREMATRAGINVGGQPSTAGRLIRILSRTGNLDATTTHQLQYALTVANRGIHGEDVGIDETMEALGIVAQFLTLHSGKPE